METGNLLVINNLSLIANKKPNTRKILDDVSMSISPKSIVGLVGESGCGKTVISKSILGFINEPLEITGGGIFFDGQNLRNLSDKRFSKIRGEKISLIIQNPISGLNPIMKVGKQVAETIMLHKKISKKDAKQQAISMLKSVGILDAEERYNSYPFELSGGQCQRVMIAIAMILKPKLLIADEPTTSLDASIETQILELLVKLKEEYGTSILLITHNISLLKKYSDYIYVMKDGKIVEHNATSELVENASHPYTKDLLHGFNLKKRNDSTDYSGEDVIVSCDGLCKRYSLGKKKGINALDNVSLSIHKGECLGLVGNSGCGKTTLSRAIIGLEKIDSGKILWNGEDINSCRKETRRKIQMIYQDSYSSLDPRMKVRSILAEPLLTYRLTNSKEELNSYIEELMRQVNLPLSYLDYFPSQLSGGQRQRVNIARAISLRPDFIICDEPVSSLDVMVQYQIIELLKDIQKRYALTYLFISHDISVVNAISNRIIKMENGKFV